MYMCSPSEFVYYSFLESLEVGKGVRLGHFLDLVFTILCLNSYDKLKITALSKRTDVHMVAELLGVCLTYHAIVLQSC